MHAILPSKGADFNVTTRPTPEPGPDELLIQVKSVALNPVDAFQRLVGFHISHYPAVLGWDLAGIVIARGSSITSPLFPVGARVAACAQVFHKEGAPDYGAFQERVVIPTANAAPLPDWVSFSEGALLPVGIYTAWAGFRILGIPIGTSSYKPPAKHGIIIWGGATSVGSAALQVARELGFVVYTTASPKHHEYLKSLGATRAFDYKADSLKQAIVGAAKEDGLLFQLGWLGAGDLQLFAEILKELKGSGDGNKIIASAPVIPESFKPVEGVDASFVSPGDDVYEFFNRVDDMNEFFRLVFNEWLTEKLQEKKFVPSPKVRLLEGGLPQIQKAFDLFPGVSGEKLVFEL